MQGTSSWQKYNINTVCVHCSCNNQAIQILSATSTSRIWLFISSSGHEGVKGWAPSCTIYSIFLFSNSYRDGQQRGRRSEIEANDLFMQNSQSSVMIPCVRSAIEVGNGRQELWRAPCFFTVKCKSCTVYVSVSSSCQH